MLCEHGNVAPCVECDIEPLKTEIEALRAECENLRSKTGLSLGVGDGNGNLFVHGDYDSIKRVQKLIFECEALRARVAELEKDNAHQRERRNAARDCINKMNGPWLLRKKAEGIDEAVRELMPRMVGAPDDPMIEFNAACEMCGEFMDYAQRLRQQADEAEQVGNK